MLQAPTARSLQPRRLATCAFERSCPLKRCSSAYIWPEEERNDTVRVCSTEQPCNAVNSILVGS